MIPREFPQSGCLDGCRDVYLAIIPICDPVCRDSLVTFPRKEVKAERVGCINVHD